MCPRCRPPPVFELRAGVGQLVGAPSSLRRICAKAITLLDQVVNFRIDLFHLDGDYNLQFFYGQWLSPPLIFAFFTAL